MAHATLQHTVLPHRTVVCSAATKPRMSGKCWLVGAGPGSVDFLTEAITEFAPSSAECIYVGKRAKQPSTKQAAIDALLVEHCLQGKQVVRLKGGCPSTFSRVSSELKALNAAGIQHEMIPGISSALAAPIFAGFPLTDAKLSTSYTVLSAHAPDNIDWSAYAKLDTLVILMAGNTIQAVMQYLQGSGWNADTPVAVIRWAGTQQQTVWRATVGTIAEKLSSEQLSPSVIVVGQVVQLGV